MAITNDTHIIETTEAHMKTLARNSLLFAGHQLGQEGDHWPVVKNTITAIMADWEALDAERAYQNEIKFYLYGQLDEMQKVLDTCSADTQDSVAPYLAEIRALYDAHFIRPAYEMLDMTDLQDLPPHLRSAEAILNTLEEEDA